MKPEFTGAGQPILSEEIQRFELEHGVSLPPGQRLFLLKVSNGGLLKIPITVAPGNIPDTEGLVRLVGFYGLFNKENPSEDLGWVLTMTPLVEYVEIGMPIGYDAVNGDLFEMVSGPHKGQIRISWYDDIAEEDSVGRYFVAESMAALCKEAFGIDLLE